MPPFRLTPSVKIIVIICVALFIVQQSIDQFFGGNLQGWLALVPNGFMFQFRFWQLFTYPFLHGDVSHLFLNMLMFVFVGSELEALWGRRRFLQFFFTCTSGAGLIFLLLQLFIWGGAGLHSPMVGASGAIYGMLLAYGILFSERVMLFMMLFPMKAKHFVLVLGGVELMSSLFSGRGGLASAAHLGGMIAGFFDLWVRAKMRQMRVTRVSDLVNPFKTSLGKKTDLKGGKPKKASGHLKLVVDREKKEGPPGDSGPTWH